MKEGSIVSSYTFIHPDTFYRLPKDFNYREYIDIERELWAFFPETIGRRVNFCQTGLTAQVYAEVGDDGSELGDQETYFLMPCADGKMKPVRMRSTRRLTLSEFRMTYLTAVKLGEELTKILDVFRSLDSKVLGELS